MKELPRFWRFIGSRSGRGFLLHLGLCAGLSVAVGYGFYFFSLTWFKEHKSAEKIIALQLVDAFVTNYSAIRSQFGKDAPVPASFRAHAIEAFNKLRVACIVLIGAAVRTLQAASIITPTAPPK